MIKSKNVRETVLLTATIAVIGFLGDEVAPLQLVSALPLMVSLQIVAGLRLGMLRGTIAAVIGSFLVEIFIHGGTPLIGIGIITSAAIWSAPVNAILPSLLLRLLGVKARIQEDGKIEANNLGIMALFLLAVVIVATSRFFLGTTSWIYRISILSLFGVGLLFFVTFEKEKTRKLLIVEVILLSALMSSLIGSSRSISVSWLNGFVNTAVPWFLWVAIYSILDLLILSFWHNVVEVKKTVLYRRLIVSISIIVAVISFLYILATFRQPINKYDEGISVYGAMRVMNGDIPYRDFWTQYAPGQFYLLALVFKLFGTSIIIERVMSTVILWGMAVLALLLAAQSMPRLPAVLVFILSVIWVADFHFYASTYPSGVLSGLLSLLFLIYFLKSRRGFWLFLSGAMIGVTTFFRHDFGIYAFLAEFLILLFSSLYLRQTTDQKSGEPSVVLRHTVMYGRPIQNIGTYLSGVCLSLLPFLVFFLITVPPCELFFDLFTFPVKIYPKVRWVPYPHFLPDLIGLFNGTATLSTCWYTMIGAMPFVFPLLIYVISIMIFVRHVFQNKTHWEKAESWFFPLYLLIGILFLMQASVRPDIAHLLPTLIPALLLFVIIMYSFASRRDTRVADFALLSILLIAGIFTFKPALINGVNVAVCSLSSMPTVIEKGRAKGTEFGWGVNGQYMEAIDYVDEHVPPGERIYVGLSRHDKISFNDIMFYFLSDRGSATKYHELFPGLATTREIQCEIRNEILKHGVRYIVLFDNKGIASNHPEPNESSISSGVSLLDYFIRSNFVAVERFGDYTILKKDTVPR